MREARVTQGRPGAKQQSDPWAPRGGLEDLADALACLPSRDDEGSARERVEQIARVYRWREHAEETAPSAARARTRIGALSIRARRLAADIAALHKLEVEALELGAKPTPLNELREKVVELAAAAERTAKWLPDQGRGERNLFHRRFKSAIWVLDVQCAELLTDHGRQ